jgi:hypothetical protein
MEAQMRRFRIVGVLAAIVTLLAVTTTASAGGWATAEVDKPVTRVEAGEETTIEFTLLQHGVTPTNWTTTYVEATNTETGETLRFDATPLSEVGRWTVDVAFPSAGSWDWSIKTDELMVEGTFPTIDVVGDAAVVSSAAGLTQAQLDAAITSATDPIEKQLSSMTGEMDVLQKQITNLTNERDTLHKQIANLEAAQAEQPEPAGGTSWWVAALAGAATALAVIAAGSFIAIRRGLIRSPRLAHVST